MQTQTTQTLTGEDPSATPTPAPGSNWPVHARGVGELLDLTVDLFVACIVPTVGLAFLMWLPVRIAWVLFGHAGSGAQAWQGLFNLFGVSLVQTMSIALVIQVVYAELQGQRTSLRKPLIQALKRAPALLLCTAIIAVATTAGCCLLAPFVYLSFIWSVAPAALVLEARGPIECLGRSRRLVSQGFLRWAGVILCALALRLPFDGAVAYLDLPQTVNWAIDELQVSPLAYSLLQVFGTSLFMAVSAAAWAILITVFYLDCRVRKEGFDLAMRLERAQNAQFSERRR